MLCVVQHWHVRQELKGVFKFDAGQREWRAGVPYFGYTRHIVMPVLFAGAVTCGAFGWALCRDEDRRAAVG